MVAAEAGMASAASGTAARAPATATRAVSRRIREGVVEEFVLDEEFKTRNLSRR
ncbi:hypothetical protein NS2_52460 [Nocardia seriolae NBRC 15557]|nr:hypothetical protein NS2_52460 [Nocardia seriolae NBRC 15557]